jgi:hypothetical protein
MTLYDKQTPEPETKVPGHPSKDVKQALEELDKATARRTRAVLGVSTDGEASLTLADEEGNAREGKKISEPRARTHGKTIWPMRARSLDSIKGLVS